ncbi:MAG: hypothetical protein ACTMIA_10725 [Vibrio sp.]
MIPERFPFNLLSYKLDEMIIKTRSDTFKDVFLRTEEIYDEEYQYAKEMHLLEDYLENYNDQYAMKMAELDHFFYRVNRVSMVLSLYSFLESSLMEICNQKKDECQIKISVTQLAGNGVNRCKNYLEIFNIINFNEHNIKKYWDKIPTFNLVRNALAHAEGDIETFNKLKESTVEGTPGLSIEDGSILMISRQYVIEHIEIVRGFLLELCKK